LGFKKHAFFTLRRRKPTRTYVKNFMQAINNRRKTDQVETLPLVGGSLNRYRHDHNLVKPATLRLQFITATPRHG